MFTLALLLFSFLGNTVGNTNTCGNNPLNTFYISNNFQLNNLNGCGVVNGSIFINGGYNIESLEPLSGLNHITGNLVIIDSHVLDSLKGLHNIQKIDGDNLYLNQYSVVIKDNINNHDDQYHGLCFSDLINWTKITTGDVLIKDNNDTCTCYSECLGCFGPGPRLCQDCKNFVSGDACVENCPSGSIISSAPFCLESKPSNPSLTLNGKTSNSISLNLIAPIHPGGFINQYDLLMDGNSIFQQTYQDNGYQTSQYSYTFTADNLKPFTNYSFDLRVFNSISSNNLSNYFIVETLPAPPSKPTNVFIDVSSSKTALINWQSPIDENGHIINYEYYLESGDVTSSENITIPVLTNQQYTYQLNNLNPFTNYTLKIRAVTNYHLGLFSDIVSFTTLQDIPSEPINLDVFNTTHQSAQLSWDTPSPSNGIISNYQYIIYNFDESINQEGLTSSRTILINQLSPFTDYKFSVAAFTVIGRGNYSNNYTFQSLEWIPSKPINLDVVNITSNQCTITFMPPTISNGNIINYNFRIDYNKQDGSYDTSGYITNTQFTIDNFEPYTKYNVSINACNQLYCSEFTDNFEFITDESIPEPPTSLNYNLVNSVDVDFQWTPPSKPNGLVTKYQYELSGTRICNGSNSILTGETNTTTTTSLSLTNLLPYANYNLKIKTCNSKGCSINSSPLNFQTGNQKPDKMSITNIDAVSNTSVEFDFLSQDINCYGNIINYEIETQDSDNEINHYIISSAIVSNSLLINDLKPFTHYNVRARAYTSDGAGEYSEYLNIKTPAGTPPVPEVPFIFNTSIKNNSLDITIDEVPNTTGIINRYMIFMYNTSGEYLIYDGNYQPSHNINNLLKDTNYWFRLSVCNTINLCSWSPNSKVVTTINVNTNDNPNNNESSGNNDELSDEAKYWIIGGSLGLIFLVLLVLLIVKLVKNHKEKKRVVADAIRPVTPSAQRTNTRSAETAFRNESYRDVPALVPRNMMLSDTNEKYQKKETDYVSEIDDTSSTESFGALNKHITNNSSKITKVIPIGVATSAINENDMELESIYDD